MSNFDNGFAVGYVLGKKSGGGGGGPCPPPEITPPFSYVYLVGEPNLQERTPRTPETPAYDTLVESI